MTICSGQWLAQGELWGASFLAYGVVPQVCQNKRTPGGRGVSTYCHRYQRFWEGVVSHTRLSPGLLSFVFARIRALRLLPCHACIWSSDGRIHIERRSREQTTAEPVEPNLPLACGMFRSILRAQWDHVRRIASASGHDAFIRGDSHTVKREGKHTLTPVVAIVED